MIKLLVLKTAVVYGHYCPWFLIISQWFLVRIHKISANVGDLNWCSHYRAFGIETTTNSIWALLGTSITVYIIFDNTYVLVYDILVYMPPCVQDITNVHFAVPLKECVNNTHTHYTWIEHHTWLQVSNKHWYMFENYRWFCYTLYKIKNN